MPPLSIPWVGVNVYAIASTSDVWGWPDPSAPTHQELLDATFGHLHAAGVDVVRFFAFQSLATNPEHERDWSALDAVFSSAQAHGIYLIPVLGNNWADCDSWPIGSAGTRKDTANWYAGAYGNPYDGYLTSYTQWVHDVVSRYSGNPALVAWEEINEPQAASDGAADRATLKAFAQDIASVIQSADPTTPVSLGSIGGGQPGFDGPSYADMLTTADMATAHDYGYPTDPLPISPSCPYGWNCIRADLRDAAEMGEPFFIGEAGDTSCDSSTKAANYAAKMRAAFDAGAVGYLLWAYDDGSPAGNCGYDFGPNGELIKIFAQF
jgi:endo-1,4-beta-mannosidase